MIWYNKKLAFLTLLEIAGTGSSSVKPLALISIIIARFILLPAIGLFVVKAAANFGFLPVDPLYQYVLVMQYAMPPAMNISKWYSLCTFKYWFLSFSYLVADIYNPMILCRYHGSAIWYRSWRVFSYPVMDIWGCNYNSHYMVNIPLVGIILRCHQLIICNQQTINRFTNNSLVIEKII